MTREERLAHHAQTVRDALKVQKDRLARIQAAQRADQRRARHRRRYRVGTLAEQAGLCAWDDATLEKLFVLLGTLEPAPNPVALLEGLLVTEQITTAVQACGAPVASAPPLGSLPHDDTTGETRDADHNGITTTRA